MAIPRGRRHLSALVVIVICGIAIAGTVRLGQQPLATARIDPVSDSLASILQLPFVASDMPASEYPYNDPEGVSIGALYIQEPVAYMALGDRIVSYDVTDPAQPEFLGRSPKLYGAVSDIVGTGSHIYVAIDYWIPPANQSGDGEYEDASVLAFDVSDPSSPVLSDWVVLGAEDLALAGNVVYAAAGQDGLHLLDISIAGHPVDVHTVPVKLALAVAVDSGYAYVSDKGDADSWPQEGGTPTPDLTAIPATTAVALQPARIRIFDVSGWPTADPHEVGHLDRDTWAEAVAVSEPYAYLASYWGLEIIDVSNRANPQLEVTMPITGELLGDIAAGPSYVYLAEQTTDVSPAVGLEVVDVSDPHRRSYVGSAAMWGGAVSVAVSGSYAYVAAGDGLRTYSIQDPANPVLLADSGRTRSWMNDIAANGQYAYVADGFRGLGVYDISNPASPVSVTWVPISSDLPFNDAAVKAVGGYAYVVFDERLVIFDLTNPAAPSQIGVSQKLRPGYAGRNDVVVSGDNAYVAIGHGMAVVDVSNPASPSLIAQADVAESSVVLSEGDYVHLPAANGLYAFDVSNPASPTEVARVEPKTLSFGAGVGTYLYTMYMGQQVSAFSVASPASPAFITTQDIGIQFHSTWVRENAGLLYVLTAKEGVKIVDGSNPAAISVVGSIDDPGYGFGVAFSGAYAFVAFGDGLEVVDVSNPASPLVTYSEQGPG